MIDILLVEDDKEICFILTELLKRNHYNVSAYHNGIEAIEALSSKKYDLMLLDLMLPCKFCSNGTPILKSAVHSF